MKDELRDELRDVLEPWLPIKQASVHWGCGREGRKLDDLLKEGLPHRKMFGKNVVQVSKAERWLEAHGYLENRGDSEYDGPNLNGAGTADTAPRPTTGGESDGS
jgi:hypothetical protein